MEQHRRGRGILLIFCLIPLCSVILFATSEVVLWRKDRIIFAADSLGEFVTTKEHRQVFDCKIHIINNYAFAAAGMMLYPDTGFDANQIIGEAIKRAHSVSEAAALADQTMGPELSEVVKHMRKHYPSEYERAKIGFIEFAIVGMLSSTQTGVAVKRLPVSGKGPALSEYSEGDGQIRARPLGPASSPFLYIRQHPAWYMEGSLEFMARKFIGLAAQQAPQYVGGPTSILQIDANGMHWLDPGECEKR